MRISDVLISTPRIIGKDGLYKTRVDVKCASNEIANGINSVELVLDLEKCLWDVNIPEVKEEDKIELSYYLSITDDVYNELIKTYLGSDCKFNVDAGVVTITDGNNDTVTIEEHIDPTDGFVIGFDGYKITNPVTKKGNVVTRVCKAIFTL